MLGKKLISVKNVPLFEVKDLLKERIDANEKGVEPTYEQNMVTDYAKRFVKLTPAKSKKLSEELKKIESISDILILKIVDVLPEDMDEINLLVPRTEKTEETALKQALELVKKYRL